MGQKIHPIGFRLGIIKNHRSIWYTNFNKYAKILQEDTFIRNYILKNLKIDVSDIAVLRNIVNNKIHLLIKTKNPGSFVGYSGINLKKLVTYIKKTLFLNFQIHIKVIEIIDYYSDAKSIANIITEQLEKRIFFKRVVSEISKQIKKSNIKGFKIQISGRLGGAEKAKIYWVHHGQVPLHTLRANIDYATAIAHTKYGVLGIKIWIFTNEILTK
uniref:Small ribosomal subunit protein uS3c n=1 Tax=Nitzschia alba TaxID=2858 RepID=A0A5C0F4S6_NITAL|nr:30S ribosomal protein S3 [Nitzschia alba]QEI59570.1 30S ribosomal protein S3 [Nitzschia alba]